MTTPAPKDDLREALAIYLMAQDECGQGEPAYGYLTHFTRHLPEWREAAHCGDCTKQSHSCVRCIAENYLARADELIAKPLAPLLAQRDAAVAERDEATRSLTAVMKSGHETSNELEALRTYYEGALFDCRTRKNAAEARARAAEDRAARLETALKPFVEDDIPTKTSDFHRGMRDLEDDEVVSVSVELGQLRQAVAALTQEPAGRLALQETGHE